MYELKTNENEFAITRLYDAPVGLVWDSWTDPARAAKWWGPRGFTITTHSKDLRVGGHWSYTMHGPDGTNYENRTLYHEVKERSLLVYDHGGSEDRPPLFRVRANFSEENGKTRMTMTMILPSAEAVREIKGFIKQANGETTWDRLAEYLAQEKNQKDIFVINRSFETPLEVLFRAWTDPKQLCEWLAPTGSSMKFFRADIRTGGESFYTMSNSNFSLYGKTKYLEITAPNKLIYIQEFCDEKEGPARHPLAPTWPAAMLTNINFEAEGLSRTRVTVQWEIYGESSQTERDTFHNAKSGMTMGWTGSFDKLEKYLVAL